MYLDYRLDYRCIRQQYIRFRLYAFVEAAALRSIVLRYASAPIATRVSFSFFRDVAFSEYFFVPFPLSLCMESTLIEFRCVVTVSTPAVWLARENIKRLTPRPCINVEYSHRVVYIEEEWKPVGPFHTSDQLSSIPIIYIPNPFST